MSPPNSLFYMLINLHVQLQALALLRASIISKTVLTDVFSRRSDVVETMVSAFKCVKNRDMTL